MNKIIVIAPHPDDETLGCGGALLKHKSRGDEIHWLIVTTINTSLGYPEDKIQKRAEEINRVSMAYDFSSVHQCEFQTTKLDTIPMTDLIQKIAEIFKVINPEVVYVPFKGDVHTDHGIVYNAVSSCMKWFRFQSVKRCLAYETLSETEFAIDPAGSAFRPNVFVDVTTFLERKIEIMKMYAGEMGEHPFPRSETAIRSLAVLRGTTSGFNAAEAFMLLKEIVE